MEVLLDSNFIVSCVKRKIDFMSQLEELGFRVILPREVFQEIKDLRLKVNHDDRLAVDIALKLIESKKMKKVGFGDGKIDEHLIKKGKEGYYVATLDNAIKRMIPNKVVISSSGNKVIVERS